MSSLTTNARSPTTSISSLATWARSATISVSRLSTKASSPTIQACWPSTYQGNSLSIDNNRLCYNDPRRPFLNNGATASEHMRDFEVSYYHTSGKFKRSEGLKEGQQKEHLRGENWRGKLSLSRSTDYRITTSPHSDLSFTVWEQFKSRALRKLDLILCVHNR